MYDRSAKKYSPFTLSKHPFVPLTARLALLTMINNGVASLRFAGEKRDFWEIQRG